MTVCVALFAQFGGVARDYFINHKGDAAEAEQVLQRCPSHHRNRTHFKNMGSYTSHNAFHWHVLLNLPYQVTASLSKPSAVVPSSTSVKILVTSLSLR